MVKTVLNYSYINPHINLCVIMKTIAAVLLSSIMGCIYAMIWGIGICNYFKRACSFLHPVQHVPEKKARPTLAAVLDCNYVQSSLRINHIATSFKRHVFCKRVQGLKLRHFTYTFI